MNTKHLKAKILDLAIRGKLVPQDSSEGNAADLLKEHNNIPEDEIPFEIPENWCWCKLDEIGETNIGLTYHPQDISADGIPVLRSNNINNNKLVLNDLVRVKTRILNNQYVKNGDILICARNGSKRLIGKCTILENLKEEMSFGAFMAIFRSNYNQYILRYLQSQHFKNYLRNSNSTQINQITQIMLKNCPLPLPPLSEQQRIVSAIEKAFEQIDIIEKNKLNLKTFIKQTKSKVLDLAIHGKLVEQNPKEGNAADLLQKEAIVQDEVPFKIPENWCWCTGNGIFSPMTSKKPDGEEFRYIDIESVDNKLQKIHYPKILKTSKAPSRASRETKIGDIVFSMVRPYLKNIARISEDLGDCIASTGFFVCRPNKFLDSKYCYYLMISSYVVNGLNQFMKGDNSPSINSDDITDFIYPIPPIEEQKRIIDRIEQIFEQLDILDKSLGE